MSANTEFLLEQMKEVEEALNEAKRLDDAVAFAALQKRLHQLQVQFGASTSALNEGRSILKG